MIGIALLFLPVLVCSVVLLFSLGHLVLALLRIPCANEITGAFVRLITGSVLFVIATATFFTSGATVMLLFIPLLVLLARPYAFTGKRALTISISKQFLFGCLLSLLLIFSFRFGQIFNPSSGVPLVPHADIVFYANCIDFLCDKGFENSSVDYLNPEGTSPYHYFELWFGAGISRLFGVNTALSEVLVVFALADFIIWLGLVTLAARIRKPGFVTMGVCMLLLAVTGVALNIYLEVGFMQYIQVYARNTLNYSKLFPVYLFVISAAVFFQNQKYRDGVLCLLAIPVASIGTAIGILAAVPAALLLGLMMKHKPDLTVIAAWIITALGLVMFYGVLTHGVSTHVDTNASGLASKLWDPSFLRTSINIAGGAALQIVLLYLPYMLFCHSYAFQVLRNYKTEPAILLTVLIWVFSLAGWAVLHDRVSSIQVFSNISIVILNIWACYGIIKTWHQNGGSRLIRFLGMVALLLMPAIHVFREYRFQYTQTPAYISKVIGLSERFSRVGVFMMDSAAYQRIHFSYVANFAILGHYLIYAERQTFPMSITPHAFVLSGQPHLQEMESLGVKNTPFWIYVEELKMAGEFTSIAAAQLRFIEEMKVNYLICSAGVQLPREFEDRVISHLEDSNTGERFYLLR